jgi:diacylglycerol kinase family enzyme
MHAYSYVKDEMEIDNYAVLVIVGGDGTIHETIQGLMGRSDNSRIPIGLIPNGTGNDTCFGLNILDVEAAVDAIIKG